MTCNSRRFLMLVSDKILCTFFGLISNRSVIKCFILIVNPCFDMKQEETDIRGLTNTSAGSLKWCCLLGKKVPDP